MKTLKISFPFSDTQPIDGQLADGFNIEQYKAGIGLMPSQSSITFYTTKGVITLGPEVFKQAVIEIS
jgi:hypothetical protein